MNEEQFHDDAMNQDDQTHPGQDQTEMQDPMYQQQQYSQEEIDVGLQNGF